MATVIPAPTFHPAPHPIPDMEGASAHEILKWAIGEYSPKIAVACSMQDAVVVDLAVGIDPTIEVFFLDTGFHFPETLATAEKIKKRYNLNLVALKPTANRAVYSVDGTEACCFARKVAPLEIYLRDKSAWITGLRAEETTARAAAKPIQWDANRGMVKVNPIISWTDEQVASYIAENKLIINPLRFRGYDSIGCAPCTSRGTGREGRWAGSDKDECGLHLSEPPLTHPAHDPTNAAHRAHE